MGCNDNRAVGAVRAGRRRSHGVGAEVKQDVLRLDEKFDSDRMKELRRKTALGFLEDKMADEAFYVFDFFEEIGLLLRNEGNSRKDTL